VVKDVRLQELYLWDRGFGFTPVVFPVCCAGSGLNDELITRSEESYCVCVCLNMGDLETSTVRWPGPI